MVIRAVSIFDAFNNQIYYETFANFSPNFLLFNRILLGMREHFIKEYDFIELGQYKVAIMNTSNYFISLLADRVNESNELQKILKFIFDRITDVIGVDATAKIINEEKLQKLTDIVVEAIRMLPIKCTLTGYGGVGKTTIVKLVARGIPVRKHIPTILADVEELKIEDVEPFRVTLFTVAGQKEYWRTWMLTTEGSDFVVLVTDSSQEDVERLQKEILPYIMKITPFSRLVIIANKQDLPDRLPPTVIEEITGYPTYGMVAISPEAKERFIEILASMIKLLP